MGSNLNHTLFNFSSSSHILPIRLNLYVTACIVMPNIGDGTLIEEFQAYSNDMKYGVKVSIGGVGK